MVNYWVVRASEDIRDSVEEGGYIAIGFGGEQIGDISGLSRDAIRARVEEHQPGPKNKIASTTGQLYRFMNEIKAGDLVLTPIREHNIVLIGQLGDYTYDLSFPSNPYRRSVEWRKTVSRDDLTTPMKNSIGGLMTVFNVSPHAEEIQQLLGEQVSQIEIDFDALNPLNIDPKARQRILAFLIERFPEHDFERVVEHVLTAMGLNVEGHGPGADSGVDLIAKQGLFEFDRIIVQVKNQKALVSNSAVRNLRGTRESGRKLFVSASGYTQEARKEAGTDIRLLTGLQLVDLLIEHYARLPLDFQARVPLKPVYLLAPVDDEEIP